VTAEFPLDRTELMRQLHRDGIATRRGVMAIHHEQAYADANARLPHTDRAAGDTLLIPLFPGLGDDAQDYVIERLAALTVALAA
jgi:dTDP-4-amino-4,6-dideoxygalactose transaminase